MTLRISEAQMESMARERFLDRVTAILADSYPESRGGLAGGDTREVMRAMYAKAHGYGFSVELDLARYIITAWILGTDFDTRYPAVAELLALQTLSPAQKSEAMEQMTTTLMEMLNQGARR